MKAVSEFVLILLILVVAVISISILWLAYYGYFKQITSSEDTSTLGEVLSSCMKIDSAKNNKIYLKNCGSGLLKNNTLSVFIDEEPFEFTMIPDSIRKGEIAEIIIKNLWKLSPDNHKIKIANPSGKVERFVKAGAHDSAVLVLDFDEGEGNIVYDKSDYENNGIFYGSLIPEKNYSTYGQGFIRDWLIIGMFYETNCACGSGFCASFISETSTFKYPGLIENDRTWFEHHNSDGYIDLDNEVFEPSIDNDYVVAYAFANVYSPTTRNVQLRVGSDDGIKAWLNGVLVHDNGDACRGTTTDDDRIPVTLNSGWNYLLIRVGDRTSGWSFVARFTDLGGNPLLDLNVSLDMRDRKWVDGKFGKALKFDGVNDYISVPLSQSLNIVGNQITVEAWIKPLGNSISNWEWQHLIDNYDGYWLDILGLPTYPNGRGNFSFRVASTTTRMYANGKTTAVRGHWYYVIGAVNISHVLIFVNGNLDGSVAFSGNLNASESPSLLIGRYKDMFDPDFNFNGTIDNIRIYNKALTPDETVSLTLGELT